MSNEFIQWLVGQSGMVAVAAFALWQLKSSYEDRLRAERDSSEAHRDDKNIMLTALRENTAALSRLIVLLERSRNVRE